mgnify:CR=1 FL=1
MIDKIKIIGAIAPQAGGAITGDYISLKNVLRCRVCVGINQVAANTVAITIEQATAVAPANSTAITKVVPIWVNLSSGVSSTLVAATAAVSYTTDAGQVNKIVIFDIDPAILDDGYDCITVKTGASSASNITCAYYECEMRYSGAEVITD